MIGGAAVAGVALVALSACACSADTGAGHRVVVIDWRDGGPVDVGPGDRLDVDMTGAPAALVACDDMGGVLVGTTCVDVDF